MANSKLQGKYFALPDHLINHFNTILSNYEIAGGKLDEQGYERLNNLTKDRRISYENLKKIKNFFDQFQNLKSAEAQGKATEFKLTGGSKFKEWIDSMLSNERENIEKTKEVSDTMQTEKILITYDQLQILLEQVNNDDGKLLAAGVYPISKSTGRICLQQRGKTINNPLQWSNWGGKADENESPMDNAIREFKEESGYEGDILEVIPSMVYEDDKVVFSNFIAIVPNEFTPPMVGKETVDGVVEVSNYRWETLDGLFEFEGKFHKGIHDYIESEYTTLKNIIAEL